MSNWWSRAEVGTRIRPSRWMGSAWRAIRRRSSGAPSGSPAKPNSLQKGFPNQMHTYKGSMMNLRAKNYHLLWGIELLAGEGEDLLGRLSLAPPGSGCSSFSFLGGRGELGPGCSERYGSPGSSASSSSFTLRAKPSQTKREEMR